MITLANLERRRDARRNKKRKGRGYGSGRGGHESTRGGKGQTARTGSSIHPSFEGGQMPLVRRLPKRGFVNTTFQENIVIINLEKLVDVPAQSVVDIEFLKKNQSIPKNACKVKVLGKGKLKHAFTVKAHAFSAGAKKKIEDVGGKVEVVSGRNCRISKTTGTSETYFIQYCTDCCL